LSPDIDTATCVQTTASVAVAFLGYYLLAGWGRLKSWAGHTFGNPEASLFLVLAQRLIGVLFLGVFLLAYARVFLSCTLSELGINIHTPLVTLYWITGLGAVILTINFFSSSNPNNLKIYPQVRIPKWGVFEILLNSLSWAAYLLAYEFAFRGLLFFICYKGMGLWPAIAVNSILYSVVHIPKGKKETIGAIPFGVLLCLITVHTGNIWAAFFTHLTLALSNDYFAVKANPEFHFSFQKR